MVKRSRKFKATRPAGQRPSSFPMYALVAAGLGLAVLVFYVLWLDRLVPLGQAGTVYYVVLIFLAAAAAVFVIGVADASAEYVGEVWGGRLKLGGPVVIFFGVMLLGLAINEARAFPQVVRVVPLDAGGAEIDGEVVLHLPTGPVDASIGEHNTALFTGLARELAGTEVEVEARVAGYTEVEPARRWPLGHDAIRVEVTRDVSPLVVRGQVLGGPDLKPVADAVVLAAGQKVGTDELGHFAMSFPAADAARTIDLQVHHDAYHSKRVEVTAARSDRGEPDEIQLLLEPK